MEKQLLKKVFRLKYYLVDFEFGFSSERWSILSITLKVIAMQLSISRNP